MKNTFYTIDEGVVYWEGIKPVSLSKKLRTVTLLEIDYDDIIHTFNEFLNLNSEYLGKKFFLAMTTQFPHKALSKLWEIKTEKSLRLENGLYSLRKHILKDGIIFTRIEESFPPIVKNVFDRIAGGTIMFFSPSSDIDEIHSSCYINPQELDISKILLEEIAILVIRVFGSEETYWALQMIFKNSNNSLYIKGEQTTQKDFISYFIHKMSNRNDKLI
jgi:hypothetical protein